MIGIIGAGAWGSALFHTLSIKNDVIITSRRKRNINKFTTFNKIFESEYIIIVIAAQEI
ncbi:MAG: glycerol-3-phosphate dehydrogenase, partial [Nitrospiraceae bacterium]|nr:glycerol-3-phosphate dehydrogenase [Nitrospiraceae bacterium]